MAEINHQSCISGHKSEVCSCCETVRLIQIHCKNKYLCTFPKLSPSKLCRNVVLQVHDENLTCSGIAISMVKARRILRACLASFPSSSQLSVACNTNDRKGTGIFYHMSDIESTEIVKKVSKQ